MCSKLFVNDFIILDNNHQHKLTTKNNDNNTKIPAIIAKNMLLVICIFDAISSILFD